VGGGQIGGNYQVGSWVFGAEFSGDWANLTGSSISTAYKVDTNSSKVNGILLATGRVGVAWNSALFYAKGGGAWARDTYSEAVTGSPSFGNGSEWRGGWTVGAGFEYGFTPNWSVAVEYDYLGLGSKSVSLVTPTTGSVANYEKITQDINMATVRLNYRFGGAY
jgi:outer membrane immunogenic protein